MEVTVRRMIAVLVVKSDAWSTRADNLIRAFLQEAGHQPGTMHSVAVSEKTVIANNFATRDVTLDRTFLATACLREHSITTFRVEELDLPAPPDYAGPSYLKWALSSFERTPIYLWQRFKRIVADSRRSEASALSQLLQILGSSFAVLTQAAVFSVLVPLMTGIVIRPIRRLFSVVGTAYIAAFVAVFGLAAWRSALVIVLQAIGTTTSLLVELSGQSNVTFALLYPVVAAATFGLLISAIAGLFKIGKSVLKTNPEVASSLNANFAYMVDPLYASDLRLAVRQEINRFNSSPEFDGILVAGKDMGALLTYEVVCSLTADSELRPTLLLTTGLTLGGIKASPAGSVYQWLPLKDWGRFSNSMPAGTLWYHLDTSWPTCDWRIEISPNAASKIPSITASQTWHRWNRGAYSSLVSRAIAWSEGCGATDFMLTDDDLLLSQMP